VTDAPVFAPDWRQPARTPGPGVPESDLSVQLSAWMLLEAAATAARAGVATTVENRDPT
jgi:predicted alpha-1,6-mannanase (GH76 family)